MDNTKTKIEYKQHESIKLNSEWHTKYNLIQKDGMIKFGDQVVRRGQQILAENPTNYFLAKFIYEILEGEIKDDRNNS